ncbi:MAG TPA: S8 family serine peptidase [Kofleriaceae bacterium]|nr:S8 family serine peptidase [Kofleriaceae bacterium]
MSYTKVHIVLVAILAACGSPGTGAPDELHRGPLSVSGKPLIQTPFGAAIADELIVRFADDRTADEAAVIADLFDGAISWSGGATGYQVVRFDSADAASLAITAMRLHPDLVFVGRSYVADGGGISTSPGPVDLQWNLWALKLDPTRGWATVNPGVRVAVLDTGIAFQDHADALGMYAQAPDLAGVPFAPGYDFVNDDAHPNDDQGHGTHVAGVIAASDGIAAIGVGAELMPVKVLDVSNRGTELALAEGIIFAVDGGADVINMSLSFPPAFYPSPFLADAIDYAVERGVVMVAATGNHGASLVAYPAAFREVIAVGASELDHEFVPRSGPTPWRYAAHRLSPADYSNKGYNVDVSAPSGRIDRDLDGDGNPEAILAQTFSGDPTQFDYYFYAGTSQASAQISGIAAIMLSENPDITPYQLRSLIGETATRDSSGVLSAAAGRGYARADLATKHADKGRATQHRDQYFAGVQIVLREVEGGARIAQATVGISGLDGRPEKQVKVYGSFTGNAHDAVVGVTDKRGLVVFESSALDGDAVLAGFQVEAVSKGNKVDHPRGSVRVDSCSLELLASFVEGAGISTSPGPITVKYASSIVPADTVPSVVLLNFAWTGAVQPMAVAIDEQWFSTAYPGAEVLRVTTFGSGISTSPLKIDPLLSFHATILEQWQPSASETCLDLVLRTFNATPVTHDYSPLIVDLDGNCGNKTAGADSTEILADMWAAWGAGISTSPIWVPGMGISQTLFDLLSVLVKSYVTFGSTNGYAVGSLNGVLDAAGIGIAPIGGVQSNSGTGIAAMNP